MVRFARSTDYKSAAFVKQAYPSAYKIEKVDGGWMVFETINEYNTWKRQK